MKKYHCENLVQFPFKSLTRRNEKKENRSLKHSLDKEDLILLNKICNLINAKAKNEVVQKQLENLVISIQNKLIEKNLS